jgi:thiamine biosynthesis lipoprotein ApbE
MNSYQYKKIIALGTTCELWYSSPIRDLDVENLFETKINELENKFSRFNPNSLLTTFNKSRPGEKSYLDLEFKQLLQNALSWMELTEGIFNPFILPSIYNNDNKISTVGELTDLDLNISVSDYPRTFEDVGKYLEIDHDYIKKLAPIYLDFGGIGKGYLTDILTDQIKNSYKEFTVSLGGDLYVHSNDAWNISISDEKAQVLKTIQLNNKAVSTSTIINSNIDTKNQIIDPSTKNTLTPEPWKQATVIASSAEAADILAKTVLINPDFVSNLIIDKYLF